MDRAQRLLRSLNKDQRIIEIGPSFRPLAPKKSGWNTFVIDHASREDLIEKYKIHSGVDTSKIEDVDFVWTGGSLIDAVPVDRHGTFDAFIASHVIEHTTDIVTFLKAAETLIRPDGIIVLALPDKRKSFDFYRHPSTTADALIAYRDARNRHDARTHFECMARTALKGGAPGWSGLDTRDPVVLKTIDAASDAFAAAEHPDYLDAHAWVFVPASFALMVLEVAALGHLDLRVEEIEEEETTEFYAWLRKGRPALSTTDLETRRKGLMDRIIFELAEQSRQLFGDRPDGASWDFVPKDRLAEAECRTKAVQTVLAAVLASQGWRGLDRRKFRALIAEAGRAVPTAGPDAAQHAVLLAEARKVLDRARPPVR